MTPDVNVLVAASREEHPHHAAARKWLLQAASHVKSNHEGTSLRLMTGVMASFLRLVTNARVFATPTPTQHAVGFLDTLLESPGVALLDASSTSTIWPVLRKLCLEKNLSANAIPDAMIAATVIQCREVLVTFDRDFLRLLQPHQLHLLTA